MKKTRNLHTIAELLEIGYLEEIRNEDNEGTEIIYNGELWFYGELNEIITNN